MDENVSIEYLHRDVMKIHRIGEEELMGIEHLTLSQEYLNERMIAE